MTTFEQVRMIMNDRDFIYYVTKLNGICQIIEANPRDPYIDKHETIMEIQAEKCLALTTDSSDNFYFMDENFIVYML
jgi:nitrogenase molybdenum-iron protein alpha/beta subunit